MYLEEIFAYRWVWWCRSMQEVVAQSSQYQSLPGRWSNFKASMDNLTKHCLKIRNKTNSEFSSMVKSTWPTTCKV